jgi:hypothetical protein
LNASKQNIPNVLWAGARIVRFGLGLLFVGAALTAAAQSSPRIIGPLRFNDPVGPCRDVQVAATGRDALAVGWIVADGPDVGVWLRWRINYLIEPAARIAVEAAVAPRDLAMAFDAGGRLHLIWTQLDGPLRVVRHARVDRPGVAPGPVETLSGLGDGAGAKPGRAGNLEVGDVDFPTLRADAEGGMLVAWQQSRGVCYSIQAASIAADGTPRSLGCVSGESLSGLNPQILTTEPPCIAWYEIDEVAGSTRVDQWHADEGRWRPSALEFQTRQFDAAGQAAFGGTTEANELIGCWQQAGDGGRTMLVVGRARPGGRVGERGLEVVDVFQEPAGEHALPSLSLSGSPTLAWQVFSDGGQRILIAPVGDTDAVRKPLVLSRPEQRFASLPSQVTTGNWSVVAWFDDANDGGDGNVYLAEVAWPAVK